MRRMDNPHTGSGTVHAVPERDTSMTFSNQHNAVTAPAQPDPRDAPPTPAAARPTALAVLREQIPRKLVRRPQWVAWMYQKRGAAWSQVPYTPGSGLPARVDKPDTWDAFDRAWAAYQDGIGPRRFDGIGFVLSPSDPYAVVALDGCIAPTGAIAPWAAAIVRDLASYTEVSPAGTGVTIWVRGFLKEPGITEGAIAIGNRERLIAVTGHRIDPQRLVAEGEDAE